MYSKCNEHLYWEDKKTQGLNLERQTDLKHKYQQKNISTSNEYVLGTKHVDKKKYKNIFKT